MIRKQKRGRFLDFNDEIILGEVGALIGSASGSYLSFLISKDDKLSPAFSVVGSIILGGILFLSEKIHDKMKRKEFSIKNLIHDLSYYTPAAAPVSIFIGYPMLYLLTGFFIGKGLNPFYSGALGAFLSFLVFLVIMNIYRTVLLHVFKKRI